MKGNLFTVLIILVVGSISGWQIWKQLGEKSQNAAAGEGRVLMDFYADWCGPCQTMKPVVKELAGDLREELTVREINVDADPELAREFGVRAIPCFVVTLDGVEIGRRTGTMSKENLRALTGL